MKIINIMNDRFNQIYEKIQDKLERLPNRDRFAVIFLVIFLIITAIGSSVWFTHKAALNQQQRLFDLKETIHWMQTNAVQLSPEQDGVSISASDKVNRVAQQQGLSVQSQVQNNQIKVSVSHKNYAVLANFLTEIARQGITIVSLDMQKQASGEILLNGTLQ